MDYLEKQAKKLQEALDAKTEELAAVRKEKMDLELKLRERVADQDKDTQEAVRS